MHQEAFAILLIFRLDDRFKYFNITKYLAVIIVKTFESLFPLVHSWCHCKWRLQWISFLIAEHTDIVSCALSPCVILSLFKPAVYGASDAPHPGAHFKCVPWHRCEKYCVNTRAHIKCTRTIHVTTNVWERLSGLQSVRIYLAAAVLYQCGDVSHSLTQLFLSSHSVSQATPHCCIIYTLLRRQGNWKSRPPLWRHAKKGGKTLHRLHLLSPVLSQLLWSRWTQENY